MPRISKRTNRKEMPFGKMLPPVGTKLLGEYRGKCYEAEIVKNADSIKGRSVKFRNRLYGSLSAAAQELTNYPVNGWRIFTIVKK